jgi:hypothetical protein
MRSGVLAEFESPETIARAYERLEMLGYTRLRSWTPYPVRGVEGRLPESKVPWIMLIAGLTGGGLGYIIQWWCNAIDYPIDVGGRPLNSAPAFVPIAFESAVLAASVTGFLVLLGFCGLPRLYHPTATVDGFERAMIDRFWLGVDGTDPRFVEDDVIGELRRLGALRCERMQVPS